MPECPECGSPPGPGGLRCPECGASLPGWDLAAAVYASELQPDYDADWADTAAVTASERKPSLSFQSRTMTSPQLLVAALPEAAREGGPQFGQAAPVPPPVGPPAAKDDAPKSPVTAPGARTPFWTPADSAPAPTGVDARMPWRSLITLIIVALVCGLAYVAYPRAHAWYLGRSVPQDLRAYVGGKGVSYAPPGDGYSVRLPKPPLHRDSASSPAVPNQLWLTMHRSIVTGPDYQIAIRVAQLPHGATLPFGLASALVDPGLSGSGRPTNAHQVDFLGRPAYDYDLGGEPPMRGRIFRYGSRLYVVTVQSKGVDRVFDELMRSFTVAG